MAKKESNKKLVSIINTKGKDADTAANEVVEAMQKFSSVAGAAQSEEDKPVLSKNEEAFNKFIEKISKRNK